jgi:hypothetical protein
MIRFKCSSCGKAMGVDDSKAGALGMCPACKSTFRIPLPDGAPPLVSSAEDATRIAPVPRPPPKRPTPPPAAPPVTYDEEVSTYAVELEPDAPALAPKRVPSIAEQYEPDEDALDDSPGSSRRASDSGVWTGDLIPGISNFALIMIFLGLGWAVLCGVTMFWPPAFILLIGAGSLISFVAGIWMLKIAFEDGMGTGLAFVFVPFYWLMFTFSNLDRTGVPFLINLVGWAYVITGLVTLWMHH